MPFEHHKETAIQAVKLATRLCESVRGELEGSTHSKEDRSPVTVADFGAQALVVLLLERDFPKIPMVGEEDASFLRSPDGEELRQRVTGHVRRFLPKSTDGEILDAIDRAHDAGGAVGQRWVLDPIDGTKGFLRGDQYAVALALLNDGEVELGVLGCPALGNQHVRANGEPRGVLFAAERGGGALQIGLADGSSRPIGVSTITDPAAASFCESVEGAHSSHSTHARIAQDLAVRGESVRIDSQCKYGVVARGEASLYLRLPTQKSYREKIWDHAAGSLVVREAGGEVTDIHGKPLDFSQGRELTENQGIVASNGALHGAVLEAVSRALALA